MKLKYLPFEQPIGQFAISVMPIKDILNIAVIERREFDQVSLDSKGGPQREASISRINEISKYAETADATFPTPILLALPEDSYKIDDNYIELDDYTTKASVVDGQHRLLGIAKSKFANEFSIPVVFILDATDEQKALIFAIINGKQTRVSASVIYDLFNVVEGRNPFKTAHEIARALNQDENSPFYRRLKMLGKKVKESNEVLSQGTFVTQLVKLISSNPADDFNKARSGQTPLARPNSIFNSYFLENKDEFILKILTNIFKAAKDVFPEEWENSNSFILAKTTGYTAIIKTLPILFKEGQSQKDLSFEYFQKIFLRFKESLEKDGIKLNSDNFPPNSIGENKLKDKILESR
jgi:DGQHR domain-containing protein